MSIQLRKQRLERLLFLLTHKQIGNASEIGKLFDCHECTAKRLVAQLRINGNKIKYEKSLNKYLLEEHVQIKVKTSNPKI